MTADLDRGTGLALWRQIAEKLRRDILDGTYRAGARLPTEAALAAELSVNRHTVRRSLAALQADGMVRVEQGRGAFVQEAVIDYRLGRRTRFSENIAAQKKTPGGRLVRAEQMPASEIIARELDLTDGAEVVLLETIGEADGRPLSLSSHYFPAARFPGLIDAYRELGSISRALAACGVADYFRKWTHITARMPREGDVALLAQPATRPVLMTESVNVDAKGGAVEYCVTRWASDRVQLTIEAGQM